ncbi:MAG TPA: alpha/beta hydrolase [Bauldia sp.]|nr:alpha/beta hydrolase [Bauldia sp.]
MSLHTIIIVALAGGLVTVALWPLRVLSAIVGHRRATLRANLAYGPLPRQRLDVYVPIAAPADAPVMVFFHGGGWAIGDKAEYGFVADALTRAGIVVVIPNYRLYPEVVFPAFVEDGAAAVAWVAASFPSRRIVLAGHSAGAHIAALLNLDARYLAACGVKPAGVVGIAGPYDFLPITKPRYARVFPPATREESQPIRFARSDAAPMLLLTGDADRTVGRGNSARLAAAIVGKGGRATVNIYPRVGHMRPVLAFARVFAAELPLVADVAGFVRSL